MKHSPRYYLLFFLITALTGSITSCSQKGLISETQPGIKHTIASSPFIGYHDQNPTFIVIGDTQPGFWIKEKFLDRRNWYTPRMFIAPFYQIYMLGSGIYGIVDYLRYNPAYGFKGRELVRDAVFTEFNKSKADFLLCTGDLVQDGRYPDHWMRFHHENKIAHPLLNKTPFLPVIGNHDFYHDKQYGNKNYREIFKHPPFYKIEYPDAALFVIDSNVIIDNGQLIDDDIQDELFETWIAAQEGSGKRSWLETELAESDKAFKIVAMHHSLLSFSRHHGDWNKESSGKDLYGKRKRLISILKNYGVQVVFCGHEHLYEHNILKYNDIKDKSQRELHFIICGSGGVPIRRKSGPDILQKYYDAYLSSGFDVTQSVYEEMYCYSLVTIDNGKMDIKVVEVNDASDNTTRIRDQIVILKR